MPSQKSQVRGYSWKTFARQMEPKTRCNVQNVVRRLGNEHANFSGLSGHFLGLCDLQFVLSGPCPSQRVRSNAMMGTARCQNECAKGAQRLFWCEARHSAAPGTGRRGGYSYHAAVLPSQAPQQRE